MVVSGGSVAVVVGAGSGSVVVVVVVVSVPAFSGTVVIVVVAAGIVAVGFVGAVWAMTGKASMLVRTTMIFFMFVSLLTIIVRSLKWSSSAFLFNLSRGVKKRVKYFDLLKLRMSFVC